MYIPGVPLIANFLIRDLYEIDFKLSIVSDPLDFFLEKRSVQN